MSDGNGRIHLLGDHRQPTSKLGKTDNQGRVLSHNASIKEVHDIVVEEASKVHSFYLDQIPPFVARMIQDALIAYALIKLDPNLDIKPVEATVEAPVVAGNAGGDPTEAASTAPPKNADIVTAFHPPLDGAT